MLTPTRYAGRNEAIKAKPQKTNTIRLITIRLNWSE
jgi:hypothetical protein